MLYFPSLRAVIEDYVRPLLGSYADDYDVVGIAAAISVYRRGLYEVDVTGYEFTRAVNRHEQV